MAKKEEDENEKTEEKFGLVAEEIEEAEEKKQEEAEEEFGDFEEEDEVYDEFVHQPRKRLESLFDKSKEDNEEEQEKEKEKEEDRYKKNEPQESENYNRLEPLESKKIEIPDFTGRRKRGTREISLERLKSVEGIRDRNAEEDVESIRAKAGKRISGDRNFKQAEGLNEGEMKESNYDIKELKKLIKKETEKEK